MSDKTIVCLFLALACVLTFSGQASADKHVTKPKKDDASVEALDDYVKEDEDPLEPLNRVIYEFNRVVDTLILKPVATGYRAVMPEKGREMVDNAVENIYMPVTFANSVLQGDPKNSFASLWSFLLDSSIGMGGLFDISKEAGLKVRKADFGQTLAVYGAGPGPYVVLPVIGPSNGRDSIGKLADIFLNPFNYISNGFSAGMWGVTAVDKRSQNMKLIDDIYASSLDPYSTFRSGYTQHRTSDINRAKMQRSNSRRAVGLE